MLAASDVGIRLAVLVACYNRAHVSRANLTLLNACLQDFALVTPTFFVLDDGSSDDTAEVVRSIGDNFHVIRGTGALYWNGGMAWAFQASLEDEPFDAYLLFNDDVTPRPAAIASALSTFCSIQAFGEAGGAVLVGPTCDEAGQLSYGGMCSGSRWRPMALDKVVPVGSLKSCDTFNGNFVLVPGYAMRNMGGVDDGFTHAYGDLDLGLRLREAGWQLIVYTDYIGVCNPSRSLFERNSTHSFWRNLQLLFSEPNGLRSFVRFALRHGRFGLAPVLILGRITNLTRRAWKARKPL